MKLKDNSRMTWKSILSLKKLPKGSFLFCEYLMSGFCHQDRMFPLRWEWSIFGSDSPIIFIELSRVFSEIDHWFDREYHPWKHFWSTISLCLVINVWFFVELYSDAMSCIFSHDWAPFIFHIFCDLISDISEEIPRPYLSNSDFPCFFRYIDDLLCFLIYSSDSVHTTRITKISIYDRRHIDIENISYFEDFITFWNTMTYNIIERDTCTLLIGSCSLSPLVATKIINTCWYSPILEDERIHDIIELECRNPSFHILSDHIECPCCEIPCLSDSFDLLGSFY